MQNFINLCNDNQGFIMIVLTAIYVIATIFILLSNRNMTKQAIKAQNQNVKLVLLEKRIEIYTVIKSFIAEIVSKATCNHEDLLKFLRDSREVNFLFDSDVINYVDELCEKGKNLILLSSEIDSNNSNRSSFVEDQSDIISWYSEKLKEIDDLFDKYINVSKLGL